MNIPAPDSSSSQEPLARAEKEKEIPSVSKEAITAAGSNTETTADTEKMAKAAEQHLLQKSIAQLEKWIPENPFSSSTLPSDLMPVIDLFDKLGTTDFLDVLNEIEKKHASEKSFLESVNKIRYIVESVVSLEQNAVQESVSINALFDHYEKMKDHSFVFKFASTYMDNLGEPLIRIYDVHLAFNWCQSLSKAKNENEIMEKLFPLPNSALFPRILQRLPKAVFDSISETAMRVSKVKDLLLSDKLKEAKIEFENEIKAYPSRIPYLLAGLEKEFISETIFNQFTTWANRALALQVLTPTTSIGPSKTDVVRLKARYEQVRTTVLSPSFEKNDKIAQMNPAEILNLSRLIDHVFTVRKQQGIKTPTMFPKTSTIVRRLHIGEDFVSIIAEADRPAYKAQGSYKIIVTAPSLFSDISKETADTIEALSLRDNPLEMLLEEPFAKKLKGAVRTWSVCLYTESHSNKDVERVSLISPRIETNLDVALRHSKSLFFDEVDDLGRQIVNLVAEMHALNLIHGDLKTPNFLINTKESRLFIADFGNTFSLGEIRPNHRILDNCYPAWWYNPPEFLILPYLNVQTASPEQLKKIESWVVGCMLLEMACQSTGGEINWMKTLMKKYNPKIGFEFPYRLTKQEFEEFQKEYQTLVTGPLQQLPAEENRSHEQHFYWVIFRLMDWNPATRWTLQQAQEYFNRHPRATKRSVEIP